MESNNQDIELDEWELQLKAKEIELKECQKQHNLDSCLKCINLLNCQLRDSFVHAVYSSMNKGKGGGFEF